MRRTLTKSIAIIGEEETEWFYFDSLRVALCQLCRESPEDLMAYSEIHKVLNLLKNQII